MAGQGGNEAGYNRRPSQVETAKVFLSNLSAETTRELLEQLFGEYGDVQSMYVSVADPPGFGFVTYSSRKSALDAAQALEGYMIGQLPMRVEPAYEVPKLTPRPSLALIETGSSLLGGIGALTEQSEDSRSTKSNVSPLKQLSGLDSMDSGEESADTEDSDATRTGSVFIEAAAKGDTQTVREVLEDTQLDPDQKRRYQARSALHLACGYGQRDVAEELLLAGADPNQMSIVGRTPLHEACQGGHVNVLSLILDYTRSILNTADKEGQSPAHMAAFHGEVGCLEVLAERGASLVAEDRFGRQPAHLAAMRDHSNVLEFLYEKGVELECACDQGKLPLHYAAQHGALTSLICLTERDCDITIGDNNGNLPIHYATYKDNLDCLRFLVKQGSHREGAQGEGKTPAHVAASHGSCKVLHWLLEKGASPNTKDIYGNTPCHYAAEAGKARCFNCLIQHHGDLSIANERDETPLDTARRAGHPLLIEKAVANETCCKQCLSVHEYKQWQSAHPAPKVVHSVNQLGQKAYYNPVPKLMTNSAKRPLYRNQTTKGASREGNTKLPFRDLAAKYFGDYLQNDVHKQKIHP